MPRATKTYNLQVINPRLSKEWHPIKNGSLTPKNITPGSGKKVWWVCKNKHEWKAAVSDRTRGRNCPYCSGRYATEENNLQKSNPELSREWHPAKNGELTPKDVTPYSNKKVWWVCKNKHEWKAAVFNRIKGSNCPYCSGRYATEENNLQKSNPKLSREWHPTKNGKLTPKDVTPYSNKKVWWVCENKHEWKAAVSSRTRGRNCPYCSGQAVCDDNCLATVNPDLAKQWHPTKNGELTPIDVTPNSHKKVWWACMKKGHEWYAMIKNRNKGRGCPYCSGRLK